MQQNDPWAAFNPQPGPSMQQAPQQQSMPARPAIRQVIAPEPEEPKVSYRKLTPSEATQRGLDPGSMWQESSQGQISSLGKITAGPGASMPNPERAQQIETILDNLSRAREIARKPLATGNIAGIEYFRNVPLVGQNAADLAGALEMAQGDLIQQARVEAKASGADIGGRQADTEKEAARIAASKANLSQSQSYDEFLTGVERAEQYYLRALARERGLDPESPEVQKQLGIKPSQSFDRALPAVSTPQQEYEIDTEKRQVVNEKWESIRPQIGAMIARGMPLDNIRMFISKNGFSPDAMGNIADIIKMRSDPRSEVSRWIKQNPGQPYPVDSLIDSEEELSGLDQLRAKAAGGEVLGVSPGAATAAALDTASMGASTEIAGLIGLLSGEGYGDARAEHVRKQQMLASENPGSTFAGGLLGGLGTAPLMGVPTGIGGLVKQGAGFGAVHGALSSEDPSLAGRLQSGATEAAIGTAVPLALDPAIRVGMRGTSGLGRTFRRATGADPEDLANEAAIETLANNMPEQDIPAMRGRLQQQEALGANPSGATIADRSGVDYLGRLSQASPQARAAADDAVGAAQRALPGQIGDDFTRAIDDAVGDENISTFLSRPAREITSDIQEMAGREFDDAIRPIYQEPVGLTDDILDVLTGEWSGPAIRDALRQPGVTPETKQILRALPRMLQDAESVMRPPSVQLGGAAAESVAQYQRAARDAMLKEIGLNVEALWRVRSAMTRKAAKMADGTPERIALRDEANVIGDVMGTLYPEWADANQLYASRMRAVDALDDARGSFLSDTDALARSTGRNSAERGQPGSLPVPSEREMAMVGAREAATDAAGKTARTSGVSTGVNLSSANQRERNRMAFGDDAARKIESRTTAKAENLETLRQVRSGATGDEGELRQRAGMQAAADFGRGWPVAGLVAALRGIRGVSNEEAGRIVKLYTTQGKGGDLLADLEKQYGKRKARFIMGRLGTISATAQMGRPEPAED